MPAPHTGPRRGSRAHTPGWGEPEELRLEPGGRRAGGAGLSRRRLRGARLCGGRPGRWEPSCSLPAFLLRTVDAELVRGLELPEGTVAADGLGLAGGGLSSTCRELRGSNLGCRSARGAGLRMGHRAQDGARATGGRSFYPRAALHSVIHSTNICGAFSLSETLCKVLKVKGDIILLSQPP